MKAAVVAVLTVGVLVACRDQQSVAPKGLSADFLDGRVTGRGNPHFFFLPPLVSQPTFSGVFNAQIQPVVDICQLDLTLLPVDCAAGGQHINPGPVVVDAPEQYHVNWDTSQPQINVNLFYRIRVFGSSGGLLLGFADMDPVANGSGLKNVNTGQYIGLVDGRTLPIMFRIEQGAFLGDQTCTDCVEATVGNGGATVVTNTGFAGAQFPAGWLASANPVVVTIERVTTVNGLPLDNLGDVLARCIPLSNTQFEGCYRFTTQPTATFATNVTVGVCATVAEPDHDVIQLFQVEEPVGGGPLIRALTNVPAPFVSCEGFASSAATAGWRGSLEWLVRQVETVVMPKRAFAYHLGAGGSTCCFSRMGWVLPAGGLMNFNLDRNGAAVTPGTIVDSLYSLSGVTFTRTMPGAVCGDSHAYANDNGPVVGGGFNFGSGNNVLTVCPEGTASDFSENSFGRMVAHLAGPAAGVCLDVWVTARQDGATGFLETFDANGTSLEKLMSDPNAYGQTLCSTRGGINSVQFAGSGDGFAEFDNLNVTFITPSSE
ncbi:MAG TPA: hypothetical protein VGV12_01230 [Gemmatimonadales bacterium]|nr:hypothetical protein [Gemmatimonadales bacterium]